MTYRIHPPADVLGSHLRHLLESPSVPPTQEATTPFFSAATRRMMMMMMMMMKKSWVAVLLLCSAFCFRTVMGALTTNNSIRRLTGQVGSEADDFIAAYANRCGHNTYELRLVLGIHFALYAEPTTTSMAPPDSGNNKEECKPLLLHADSSSDDGKAKTVVEVERLDDKDMSTPPFFWQGSLPLGTFRLHDIADAFQAIEVDAVAGDRTYDIVTNNCAVLMLGMMKTLGIQLSNEQRQAVVQGLIAADANAQGRVAGYIREGNEIERTLGLTRDASNEELLESLVLGQIAAALDHDQRVPPPPAQMQRELEREEDRSLIIDGTPTNGQEFPFYVQAMDVYPTAKLCGAVLVARDVILTTASCETAFLYGAKVLVGATKLSNTTGKAQWRTITSDIMVHPDYQETKTTFGLRREFDFALMKIQAVTRPNLIPVKLNANNENPKAQQSLTVLGFGRTTKIGNGPYRPSKVLRKLTATATSWADCQFQIGLRKLSNFCTYNFAAGPCQGDRGGPIIDKKRTLVGLTSFTDECASSSNVPVAYARVSGSIEWIRETICKLSDFSSTYPFCPKFVCPPDLRLLGYPNAVLPSVNASTTKPATSNTTQVPEAGTVLAAGTRTLVNVTATNPNNNVTVSCQWAVSVVPLKADLQVPFEVKEGNTSEVQAYTMAVPWTGKFHEVEAKFTGLATDVNGSISVEFKRTPLPFNASTQTTLQTYTVEGTIEQYVYTQRFNVTIDVGPPDSPDVHVLAYFTAKGVKTAGTATYYLYGQRKKM